MSFSKLALVCISPLTLLACALTPPVTFSEERNVRLECTTATPVVDGTAVTACVTDIVPLDKGGKPDPVNTVRQAHVFSATPTVANVAVGSTSGALAAHIQAKGLKEAAEIGQCPEGANCGTQILNLNNNNALGVGGAGGGAIAGAASNSNAAAAANVGSSSPTYGPK